MRIDHNLGELSEDLMKMAAAYEVDIAKAVRDTTAMIQTRVRANASSYTHRTTKDKRTAPHVSVGDPDGPNVRTGNYRNSIQITTGWEGALLVGYVHTNAAQARRLEYGFRGTDALGRRYNQPPYPHWGPAADWGEDVLEDLVKRRVDKAIEDFNRGR